MAQIQRIGDRAIGPHRACLIRLFQYLLQSDVPREIYEQEIQFLVAAEGIRLENLESVFKACAPVGDLTAQQRLALSETITRQEERYRVAHKRKKGDADTFFAGARRDAFGNGSAADLVRDHVHHFRSRTTKDEKNDNPRQNKRGRGRGKGRQNNRGRGQGRGRGRNKGRGKKRKRQNDQARAREDAESTT